MIELEQGKKKKEKEKEKKIIYIFRSSQAARQDRLLENNVSLVTCYSALQVTRVSSDPISNVHP